ncbi:MAG: NosD domain-containing protein [Gemmatimonadales bacterium]
MIIASLLPLLLAAAAATTASVSEAPCLRPTRAGTQVQGDVRVCPGKYRIADPGEKGVIIAAASGTRIDLSGVTLESGDSVPARYAGIGIVSRGVDGVTVLGGIVRGYRFGIRIEGGRGHRVTGIDLSGSRSQPLRSTAERTDSVDRLDPYHLKVLDTYGGGLLLQGTGGATITGVIARGAQNGIGLVDSRDGYVADNDFSGNSGWGLNLWRSSHNAVVRNQAGRTRRCEKDGGCDAAAILVREGSDSNTFSDNDLTDSSIGVLVTGASPLSRASVGNLFNRNDASQAIESGFMVRLTWATTFFENRADSSGTGFKLVRASGQSIRGNTVIGSRDAGVGAASGSDNAIQQNVLLGGRVGIEVLATDGSAPPGRSYRIDDNVIGSVTRGIVLQGVARSRIRGNVIDGVDEAVVIDSTGHATEVTGNVFLRASGSYIVAPDLAAGGNYWATPDARAAAGRVQGRISVLPWKPASAAGY